MSFTFRRSDQNLGSSIRLNIILDWTNCICLGGKVNLRHR